MPYSFDLAEHLAVPAGLEVVRSKQRRAKRGMAFALALEPERRKTTVKEGEHSWQIAQPNR